MNSALVQAIRVGDIDIMDLFQQEFDQAAKWVNYLKKYFGPGDDLSVSKVLDMTDRWHSERFQALYVACWIYHPLEKGSFMISLTAKQAENAQASADQLGFRKSSHLSSTSRSARGGHDVKFIKGYSEILVIVENQFLFLKMEGHKASSPSHLKSWYTKIKTGAGETANQQLNDLATGQNDFGIMERGAENFSKPYKALLKALGLSGKSVNFRQVIEKLQEKFPTVALPNAGGDPAGALRVYFQRVDAEMSRPATIAKRDVKLYEAWGSARKDLNEILKNLVNDSLRMPHNGADSLGIDRIFHEVRATPADIDEKLNDFVAAVQAADLDGVKANNDVASVLEI